MGLFKRKTEKELKAELAMLQSKAKIKAHRKKLKADIRKLKYGKIVKGAKIVGKGAVKALDVIAPPRRTIKRKRRRRRNGYFDYGFGF